MRFWPWPVPAAESAYSDGSQAARAWIGTWPSSAGHRPGDSQEKAGQTRTVGVTRQSVYPAPFAVERADPSVFAWDFNGKPMFMFIATDDTVAIAWTERRQNPYAVAHR